MSWEFLGWSRCPTGLEKGQEGITRVTPMPTWTRPCTMIRAMGDPGTCFWVLSAAHSKCLAEGLCAACPPGSTQPGSEDLQRAAAPPCIGVQYCWLVAFSVWIPRLFSFFCALFERIISIIFCTAGSEPHFPQDLGDTPLPICKGLPSETPRAPVSPRPAWVTRIGKNLPT